MRYDAALRGRTGELMAKTLILCDSTCDLTIEQEQKLGIRIINCGVELNGLPYKERTEIDSAAVYDAVAKTGVLPSHSQVTVIEFIDAYVRAARDGYTDIICVTMNSKGSGTHSAALHAVTLLPSEYPALEGKVNIRVIDSGTYALAIGGPVSLAAERVKKGEDTQAVADWLEDYFAHQITLVGLFSLQYAKKSGRLGSCAAIVGEALGIKPIMAIAGENRVLDKVRGDKNLVPKMARIYKELAADAENGEYIVAYGDSPEAAKELVAAIKKAGGKSPTLMGPIGPCVAINAGPKMLGLGFRRK